MDFDEDGYPIINQGITRAEMALCVFSAVGAERRQDGGIWTMVAEIGVPVEEFMQVMGSKCWSVLGGELLLVFVFLVASCLRISLHVHGFVDGLLVNLL